MKKVRDRSDKLEPARGHPEIFEAIRKANARKFRGFEAWEKAIELVKNAVDLPFDEGMEKERAIFMANCSRPPSPRRSAMSFSLSGRRPKSPTSPPIRRRERSPRLA